MFVLILFAFLSWKRRSDKGRKWRETPFEQILLFVHFVPKKAKRDVKPTR